MRMTASWSGSNDPTVYKSVARRCAPMASSPRILNDRQAPSDAEAMQKAPVAVHHRSACSGVKALRNTSDARRQAAKLCYRFGPLTPSARSANLIPGDGTKNGLSRSEQKTVSTTQNNRLTGKAPYKFESISLQRRVRNEPDPLAAGTPVNTPIRSVPPGYPSPRASAPLRVRLRCPWYDHARDRKQKPGRTGTCDAA